MEQKEKEMILTLRLEQAVVWLKKPLVFLFNDL